MQHVRGARRAFLLSLSLLSACAASEPSSGSAADQSQNGVLGNYLVGRFALSEGDSTTAANDLLKAVAQRPDDPELILQAFVACLAAGRPEAVKLARQLPDSQVAQLVLADVDIKAGHWSAAEQRFRGLPRQGLTQLLQPLLLAWAQLGDKRVDAALSTLQPYVDNPRFRGIFALNAAMIADIGNREEEAGKLYHVVETDVSEPNLRLAQILASWQARTGQPADAQKILGGLPTVAPELGIAMPSLLANVTKQPVARPSDGVAEAYFTFAALLRAQEADEFSLIMLHLALDLRPDLTAAKLLAADILVNERHPQVALHMLNDVATTDPIYPVVQLRRAAIVDRLGKADDAMRDLERLSHDYPESSLPDLQRGDILRMKQRFPDAVAAYDRAIVRDTLPAATDWVMFYDRGVAEERSHQWQKAEADFNHALELSPDQPFVLNYLGYSWADSGHHLAKARQMIERAAEKRPNDGAITDSLGWVMFRQGDAKDAVKTLERAVEMEPEDSTINAHLGDAYWAAGRKVEAQYQWRRALTLNPAPDDAVKLEAKLNTGHVGAVLSGQ
ncbi:tetratricopeptide repeat protein [Rhodopila sp.]|uniref:tetratricopeptide repeat protein n=1 Tax=Rhodopila sp. TaxID=2480087 RepID=UPI003D129F8C